MSKRKQTRVPAQRELRNLARIWGGRIPGTHEPGFIERPVLEYAVPRVLQELHDRMGSKEVHLFWMGECRAILSLDDGRWHLTISCADRHPTWDELKTARYRICGPDITMAMITPPVERYVNIPSQDHVFHFWQLLEEAEGW